MNPALRTLFWIALVTCVFGIVHAWSGGEKVSFPIVSELRLDSVWERIRPPPRPSSSDWPAVKAERLRLMAEENDWKNGFVQWMLPAEWWDRMPRITRSWFRNFVGVNVVYFSCCGVWSYICYVVFGRELYGGGDKIPSLRAQLEQIKVSSLAMPLYSLLPAAAEFAVEKGWTKAYPRVSDHGLLMHLVYFVFYMTSVEFGVYWNHRLLHEIDWAYKYLHRPHHVYNKEHTLSPWAGLAFHPLDGILQAVPYVWTLFYCPCHFLTHELLLFATGVWTTNIHDCLHGNVDPIMGGGYHLIHHTTYKHNYGHYFTYMDRIFGSLLTPEEHERMRADKAK